MGFWSPEYRMRALCIGVACLVVILDQSSKWLVEMRIPQGHAVEVLPGFFDLVNIRNRGAAFGFLNRSDIEWQFWLFMGATLLAIWAIFSLLRSSRHQPCLGVALGLILGGAVGNMIDRVRYRAVVDFLDFYWGLWHWPAFNVADIAICAGTGLAFLAMWPHKKGKGA